MFYVNKPQAFIGIHPPLNVAQVDVNPAQDDDYEPLPPEPSEGDKSEDAKVKGHWDKRLTSFQKLMFIKAFQEEKVTVTFQHPCFHAGPIV